MMKTARHEPDGEPDPVKTAIWETEGTGTGHNTRMDQHFGRRIEPDRTWTIYHVYSGMPAVAGGQGMTGLSRSDATDGMLFLNDRNAKAPGASKRRRKQARARSFGLPAGSVAPDRTPLMALSFPNPSRSFDESRKGVRFVGHDGVFEVPFFIEADALAKAGGTTARPDISQGRLPVGFRPAAHHHSRRRARDPRKTSRHVPHPERLGLPVEGNGRLTSWPVLPPSASRGQRPEPGSVFGKGGKNPVKGLPVDMGCEAPLPHRQSPSRARNCGASAEPVSRRSSPRGG